MPIPKNQKMVLQLSSDFSPGRIVRRSITKLFHPSSTLDGRSKIESFKRAVISRCGSSRRWNGPKACPRANYGPARRYRSGASERFGLKWTDINFKKSEISVTRSIVMQVVGPCKTEASQKPVPLDPLLARTLRTWLAHTKYKGASDWVFASPYRGGRKPYWYQSLMRNRIREVARCVGINKKIGWHTFRHTCATLLRASGADIKVVQELLRHASCRVTLDTYTQAVTEQKRAAQKQGR
jgi:integrase